MTLLITTVQVTRTFSSKNTVWASFYCLYLRFKIRKTFLISKPWFLGMGLPGQFGSSYLMCACLISLSPCLSLTLPFFLANPFGSQQWPEWLLITDACCRQQTGSEHLLFRDDRRKTLPTFQLGGMCLIQDR